MADEKLGFVEFANKIREKILEAIRNELRTRGKCGDIPISKNGGVCIESEEDGIYCCFYDDEWVKTKVENIPYIFDNIYHRRYIGQILRTDAAAFMNNFEDSIGNSTSVEQVLRGLCDTLTIVRI